MASKQIKSADKKQKSAIKKNALPSKTKKDIDEEIDEDDDVDVPDDWENKEEEESWDPDFNEFDIPSSKNKKGGKKGEDDDDFKMDEDFKEFGLFDDDSGNDFDDDDDF